MFSNLRKTKCNRLIWHKYNFNMKCFILYLLTDIYSYCVTNWNCYWKWNINNVRNRIEDGWVGVSVCLCLRLYLWVQTQTPLHVPALSHDCSSSLSLKIGHSAQHSSISAPTNCSLCQHQLCSWSQMSSVDQYWTRKWRQSRASPQDLLRVLGKGCVTCIKHVKQRNEDTVCLVSFSDHLSVWFIEHHGS